MQRARRPQTLSVLFAYVSVGAFWGAFGASTPAFQETSGLTPAGFGLLLLAMPAGAIPAMTISGWIGDRLARWAVPGSFGTFALAAILLGAAGDLSTLVPAFLLVGAASGAADVALNLRISAVERMSGARLFNQAHGTFPLALVATGPLVGLARDRGVDIGLIFAGVGLLILAAAVLEATTSHPTERETAPDETGPKGGFRLSGLLLLMAFIAALGAFQEMAAQSWSAIYVETVLLASASVGGLAPTAFMLGLSAARFLAHRLEARVPPLRLLVLMAGLGLPAFALVALGATWPVALIGLALAGIAVGPVEPAMFRSVTERARDSSRGATLSAVTTIAYVGYLASPPLLGAVAEKLGWTAFWLILGALAASVAALTAVLRRRQDG